MITITEYIWAGKWGPFKIKSHCKECDVTWGILKDLQIKGVKVEQKPWLDHWIYCLRKGAFHPPIVMVDGKKFHQFSKKDPLVNKNTLTTFVKTLLEQK